MKESHSTCIYSRAGIQREGEGDEGLLQVRPDRKGDMDLRLCPITDTEPEKSFRNGNPTVRFES